MKAHVVLANPPYPDEAPQSIFIPLGIGYLAAVLEEKGYEVDVVDCQVSRPSQKELEDKFKYLAGLVLSNGKVAQLTQLLDGLENLEDINKLTKLLY